MGEDEDVDAVADRAGHHRDVQRVQRALRGLLAPRRPAASKLYRVAAILASFLAHFAILYIPPLSKVFSVALIMLSVICYELIDPNQQAVLFILNIGVGSRVDETIRVIKGLQFSDLHKEDCHAN